MARQDPRLEPELQIELPGIPNRALDGLERLTTSGRFTRPESADVAMIALQDLASPVAAFVRDRCVMEAAARSQLTTSMRAWRTWAEDNGQRKSTKQTFGRDLRAAVPLLRVVRPRDGEERLRLYRGIRLRQPT